MGQEYAHLSLWKKKNRAGIEDPSSVIYSNQPQPECAG